MRGALSLVLRAALTGLYFTALAPFGLATRRLADPLRLKPSPRRTHWVPWKRPQQSLKEARTQL